MGTRARRSVNSGRSRSLGDLGVGWFHGAYWRATANLTAVHVVGQIRLIAVDLLRATGLERTPRAGGPANGGAGPALTPHRIRRDWTQSGGVDSPG
jgi:hypothetical protein